MTIVTATRASLGMLLVVAVMALGLPPSQAAENAPAPPAQKSGGEGVLPPVGSLLKDEGTLSAAARVHVRQFRFDGNTVFSDAELAGVTAPFLDRDLAAEELEEARRQLTLHYVNRGFINSGALLKDQTVTDGVVTFTIAEGTLSDIRVFGSRRFRPSYLADRMWREAGPPFNLNTMRDGLQVLQQNPNIERINAELKPGLRPGESYLEATIHEQSPHELHLRFNNQRPASIGAERFELLYSNTNLTGYDDSLEIRYGLTRGGRRELQFAGPDDVSLSYTSRMDDHDTRLQVSYTKTDSEVIEEPFTALDISSRSTSLGVTLSRPAYTTLNRETTRSLTLEHRKSESFLLGMPFSFSPGSVNGQSAVTVLRFGQDWVSRRRDRVFAARSVVTWGVDALSATDDGSHRDGKFVSWLGQAQLVKRLGDTPNRLVLRLNAQWADDPLLSLEQFSLGGAKSVRGYRENQLVRDKGVVASAEARLPVVFARTGQEILEVAPFLDFGYGANVGDVNDNPNTLYSLGLGLLYRPDERLAMQLYWGHGFRGFAAGESDLQDRGIHFNLTYKVL